MIGRFDSGVLQVLESPSDTSDMQLAKAIDKESGEIPEQPTLL